MPSFVWDRDPAEAFANPYEYGAQEQFVREATALLGQLTSQYAQKDGKFHPDDRSKEKAVWMLQVDALSALSESIELAELKRHRVVSRLFRDIVETLDVSLFFAHGGDRAELMLTQWYDNKVIAHRVFREFATGYKSKSHADNLRVLYGGLSKLTHRTYLALAMSYISTVNDLMAYDGFRKSSDNYVLPHTLSYSYAVIAKLLTRFVAYAVETMQLTQEEAADFWASCLETKTVPRRFSFFWGKKPYWPEA